MKKNIDMFDWLKGRVPSEYPNIAGYKDPTTSKEAATAIETTGRAAILRELVLEYYNGGCQNTADEMAWILGESILSIRPRVSELFKQGLLRRTGMKRKSDGGKASHVMAAVK